MSSRVFGFVNLFDEDRGVLLVHNHCEIVTGEHDESDPDGLIGEESSVRNWLPLSLYFLSVEDQLFFRWLAESGIGLNQGDC